METILGSLLLHRGAAGYLCRTLSGPPTTDHSYTNTRLTDTLSKVQRTENARITEHSSQSPPNNTGPQPGGEASYVCRLEAAPVSLFARENVPDPGWFLPARGGGVAPWMWPIGRGDAAGASVDVPDPVQDGLCWPTPRASDRNVSPPRFAGFLTRFAWLLS